MNAPSKRALRNLVILSLTGGSYDDESAHEVLVGAIGRLHSDLFAASLAYSNVGPAGKATFEGTLIALAGRAKALKTFAAECLDADFVALGDEPKVGAP